MPTTATSPFQIKPLPHRGGGPSGEGLSQEMVIEASVLESIRAQIGGRPAEHGGVLGGSREDGVIRHFYFDGTAQRSGGTYSPDHVTVNRLFDETWNPEGINLLGFVHSHPAGCRQPSSGDLVYARNILHAIPSLDQLFLPIIMTVPDTGQFELLPFRAVRDGEGVRAEVMSLRIADDEHQPQLPTTLPDNLQPLRREKIAFCVVICTCLIMVAIINAWRSLRAATRSVR
jgi:proteasome lid subunit RPN8/RPN11